MNHGDHHYALELEWLGNTGQGTRTYEGYSREHVVRIAGKPDLRGTADPMFRGDATLHNPEDLLLAALSQCHLLTYLALCARARINVLSYRDHAEGTLLLTKDGGGHFTEAVLRPTVVVADAAMLEKARYFHGEVHKYCFIARSVNFPVRCEPVVRIG
ncbi:MAG TPA: OsmC family protein [Flavobacteriales bacterium]|nr:OsmC family protein [Flavobacteriales bacterium]HQW87160.1 OsmC family protein [Flavobacteriales bacterium]